MSLKHIIFRIVFFVVALSHCISFYDASILVIDDYEKYSIELLDLDLNESDSEEKEEEHNVLHCDTDKFGCLAICFIKISDCDKIDFSHINKIQSPFLSIPYSPPEMKI